MLISSGAGSSGTGSFTSDACAGMQSSGSSGGSGRSKLAGFALHLGSTVADACSGVGATCGSEKSRRSVLDGPGVLDASSGCTDLRKHADDFLQECGIVLVLRHHALQVHVRSGHCCCMAEKMADTGKNGSCDCDSRTCCDMRCYQRNGGRRPHAAERPHLGFVSSRHAV